MQFLVALVLVGLAASAHGAELRFRRGAEVNEEGVCTAAIHAEGQNSVDQQDSPLDSDLEVPPAKMSMSCKNIFAPLQSKDVNLEREKCKCKYSGSDEASTACKDRCILENTGFVDKSTGKVMVAPFKNVMNEVVLVKDKSAATKSMVPRMIKGFEFCHDQAKTYNSELSKDNCESPVYTKYGICLWEFVNKLCLGVNNRYSNTDEPWAKKA